MKTNTIDPEKRKLATVSGLMLVLAASLFCPSTGAWTEAIPVALIVLAAIQIFFALKGSAPVEVVEKTEATPVVAPVQTTRDDQTEAELVHLLSLLQEKGRFIDFVMDDITPYADAQVAAAARVVHQGCQKFVKDNFAVEAIAESAEGQSLTLDKGYEASDYRLLGNVAAEPPHTGTILHRGWRVNGISMSRLTDAAIQNGKLPVIAPAELEIK